jgi:hypothetical protein
MASRTGGRGDLHAGQDPLAPGDIFTVFVSGCCYIPDFIFDGRMTLELLIGKRRATAIFWVK